MTEDLTRLEQDNVIAISNLVKPYWGVSFVPAPLFSRDKLKCGVDGETAVRHLDIG